MKMADRDSINVLAANASRNDGNEYELGALPAIQPQPEKSRSRLKIIAIMTALSVSILHSRISDATAIWVSA